MIEKTLPFLLLLGAACSTQGANVPGTGTPPAPNPDLVEAERLLATGDIDGALAATDRILDQDPDDRAARILAARGNIALFDSGRQGAEFFLDDAIHNLERALDLQGDDPKALLTLSWCQLRKSEFSAGRGLALKAADLLRERRAPDAEVANALLQAAEHDMQIFVDARRAEMSEGVERPSKEAKSLANQVLATLRSAEQLGAIGPALVRSSQVYRWMNRSGEALKVLENGIAKAPDSAELNNEFQKVHSDMGMRAECVTAYKRMLSQAQGSSALTWYLGRAQVALGDDMRRATRFEDAARVYAEALASYHRYDASRPGDHAGTSQWIAICELSLGRLSFERGELDDAKAHYFAAFEASPLCAEYREDGLPKIFDSFGGNYLGGLSLIGQTISEGSEHDALRKSLAFWDEVIDHHPGRFGSIFNNAALSARDLGAQIAGQDDTYVGPVEAAAAEGARRERLTEAMALWEKSYAYYEQAVKLEPDDARIVNDCGLMLVYHLHRDYDRARAMFEKAIELGEAQLDEMPENTDARIRNDLEEATGDAWQNIGVMLQDRLGRPFEEAKPFFERAIEFYPYQRREAAVYLRDAGRRAFEQDPRKVKFDREIGRAKAAADEEDYDTALLVMDGLAKEMGGYPPYHYFAGLWSLRYAEVAAKQGGGAGLVDGLFQDAARQLGRAVELDGDPNQPRLALGQALLATGQFDEAAEVAESLLSHVRSAGGAPEEFMVQAHALRAEATARAFVAKKQRDETDEDLLRAARASFREIEQTDAFDAGKRSLWVATEQWADADEQAVQIMVRAWRRDRALVGDLVQTGAKLSESGAVVAALSGEDDATTLWYCGKACFDRGRQLWSAGEQDQAIASLDDGITRFERSMQVNSEFRPSCEQWIALSLGQKGIVQTSKDDLAGAEESLIAATEKRPDVFTNDLGGGSSIRRGVLILADRHYQAGDLAKVAAIYRRVGAAVPNDVDIANNEGLFCRDHADALVRQGGATEQTRDLYEASYAAYTRASELDPRNVRLRNDRALILVYSLQRDLDLAERILKSAVADGDVQLEDSPPEDADELRNVQEAVGDAHGNLGVLYMNREDYPAARQHLEQSLEYYPYRRRAGTGLLQRLGQLEKQGENKKDSQ